MTSDINPLIPQTAERIRVVYERLLGRPCEASYFCVHKETACGYYGVHLLDETWFYQVRVRRLT